MGRGEPGSLRSVALPTEHGGWGFTLEPVILGLAVAPGWAGVGLAVAAVAVFLARRPLRLLMEDLRRHRRLARTRTAAGVLAVAAAAGGGGFAVACRLADGPFWWAVAAALPLAACQLGADLSRRGRAFLAEAAGALAMGAAAPAIALAGGWRAAPAFALWAVLAARSLPSILLVRAMIRRAKGEPARAGWVHPAHAGALGAAAALSWAQAAPWTAAASLALLWAWAASSLSRPPVAARTLGWTQVLAGLVVVSATAAGYHLGW